MDESSFLDRFVWADDTSSPPADSIPEWVAAQPAPTSGIPELTELPEGTPAKRRRGKVRPWNMPTKPTRTAEDGASIVNQRLARIICAQVQRVQALRYAGYARTGYYTIPNGEMVQVHALAVAMRRAGRHAGRIATTLEQRAPWLSEEDIVGMVGCAARLADVGRGLGVLISMTAEEQCEAKAWHLQSVDGETPEERRVSDGREGRRERRQAKGALTREQADARKREAAAKKGSDRQREPWKALGMCKRSYYNHKKAGTLPTQQFAPGSAGDHSLITSAAALPGATGAEAVSNTAQPSAAHAGQVADIHRAADKSRRSPAQRLIATNAPTQAPTLQPAIQDVTREPTTDAPDGAPAQGPRIMHAGQPPISTRHAGVGHPPLPRAPKGVSGARGASKVHPLTGRHAVTVTARSTASLWTPDAIATLVAVATRTFGAAA